uniref:Chemokine (C-C motif) ligand 39, duplicate 2 n=1 Tax=Sinocyclocheilus grahami TaxID=75366 RepID=A0A672RGN2_SINGR
MRSLMCVLFVVLFSDAYAVPVWCCFDFVDFDIPAKKIVSAVKTHSHYPVPAIVVTTPRTEICVKPDEAWIKKYNGEAALEMKKKTIQMHKIILLLLYTSVLS